MGKLRKQLKTNLEHNVVEFYPYTDFEGVLDENGTTLKKTLDNLENTTGNIFAVVDETVSDKNGLKLNAETLNGYTANDFMKKSEMDEYVTESELEDKLSNYTPSDTTSGITSLKDLGITATATELNKLDGVTASTTELNYVNGATSNIQTQLNNKAKASHQHTTSEISNFPSTMTPSSHNQSAATITSGTFAGNVIAPASTAYTTSHIRNIKFTTTDPGDGASASEPNGTLVCVYEA